MSAVAEEARECRIPMMSTEEAVATAETIGVPAVIAPFSVFRVLLHHPDVAKALADLQSTLMFKADFDDRLRELLIMRMAWVMGSEYAWSRHWRQARLSGVPHDDLVAVRDWKGSDRFSTADRAVLAATDEILEYGAPTEQTWAECRKYFPTAKQQIELVVSLGSWRLMSQVIASLAIPLEDNVDSWPPDGVLPR